MASVYLETSFFSECATIRTGAIDLGRRATSLSWWKRQASAFELFTSNEVLRELSDPDFPAAVRDVAMAMLGGLSVLALSPETIGLAELLVRERVMPGPAVAGDAVHVASSILNQMDYILAWNQKHLANPNKRTHLAIICARINLPAPQIVTPDLLIMEMENE